jgi:prefoldin subunit 2
LPQVQSNLEGINQILAQLVQTYKKKEAEIEEFAKKNELAVK